MPSTTRRVVSLCRTRRSRSTRRLEKEIGKLTVSDPEGGSFTYELVDNADGSFALDTAGVLKVANGIKLDRPYTKTDNGGALAFITDPWGTYIELNERPNPVYLP